MEAKHTKGLWFKGDKLIGGYAVVLAEGGRMKVADVCGMVGEQEANAALIAAAPELLEALKRIADWEYRADRRARGMVDASEVEALKRIAREALAKAEGR